MSFFQLPAIPYRTDINNIFSLQYTDNCEVKPSINKTLMSYLTNIKTEIDNRQDDWDRFKKYTNPYEYIHTCVPNTNQSISKLKPLSRSYYKMIELCGLLDLLSALPKNCKTFHIAEGPGGFIEAMCALRLNPSDKYTGISLIDDTNYSVPGWKKSKKFLDKHQNVYIETGKTKTGDIMSPDNLKYCFDKYCNTIDLVTADGGFDFSIDFNHQESVSSKLILSQIAFASAVQKDGGCFVIKFFDTFTQVSLDMIYLLSLLYENVYFVKPFTSRYANSEKYLVCKNFRCHDRNGLINSFIRVFNSFTDGDVMLRLLSIDIPYLYSCKVQEFNAIFGQQQIETISSTLNLIDNNKYERLETLKKTNIQKCMAWCQKYDVPFNKSISNANLFLPAKNV